MSDDDLFFVSRNGFVWACWLSGKPAVNLGSEAEARTAMKQFLGVAQDAPQTRVRVSPPAPATSPVARAGPSVWASAEHRYIEPTPPEQPPSPPSRTLKERASARHELTITGRIFTSGGSRDVTILDLSETGCQFHDGGGQLKIDGQLTVKLGPIGPVEATVRWLREHKVGVQFNSPLYPSVLEHIRDHFDLRRR